MHQLEFLIVLIKREIENTKELIRIFKKKSHFKRNGLFFISYDNGIFQPFLVNGLLLDIVLILIGIYFAIKYLVDKNKYERMENPKSNSIVTEFVKAKYNKYCPKIDWE
jgi:predicted membrane protein